MFSRPTTPRTLPPQCGFTLVELMIAVVVVALLAAIALPSFMDSIRKGRRSEGIAALMAVQQAQERWRANRPTYSASVDNASSDAVVPGLGLPGTTPTGYYAISVQAPPEPWTWATGYEARAVAVAGSQLADGDCKVLAVRMQGGNLTYGSGASADAMLWPDAGRCWAR